MQTAYFEQWTSFGQSAFSSLKELSEINARAFERLAEQQLDFMNSCMDVGIKQWELLGDAKGYKDLFSGETKLIADYNEKLLETVRKTTDIATTSKDELTAWFDKGIESVMAPVKKSVVSAIKKTGTN